MAGVPDALIFFCFFSSIKGRKEDPSREEKKVIKRREEATCWQNPFLRPLFFTIYN